MYAMKCSRKEFASAEVKSVIKKKTKYVFKTHQAWEFSKKDVVERRELREERFQLASAETSMQKKIGFRLRVQDWNIGVRSCGYVLVL